MSITTHINDKYELYRTIRDYLFHLIKHPNQANEIARDSELYKRGYVRLNTEYHKDGSISFSTVVSIKGLWYVYIWNRNSMNLYHWTLGLALQ